MSEPVAIERLLLPGERVLWEGRARERPLGPVVFDAGVFFGCIVVPPALLVISVLIPIAFRIVTGPWTRELLWQQGAATLGLLVIVGLVVWAGRGLVRNVRKRLAQSSARYFVTTMRVLRRGAALEDEKIVGMEELASGEAAVERAGTSVRLLSPAREILVAFDDLENPIDDATAVARVLREARERSAPVPDSGAQVPGHGSGSPTEPSETK